jgi:hypothetical protein
MNTAPQSSPAVAFVSLLSAIVALAILIIPFVGVFASALLGPLAVVLGGLELHKSTQGAPYRKIALSGLVIGVIAIVVLIVFLATGTYSERAR